MQYEAAQLEQPVQKDKPVTVERAIQIFLGDKKGARADETRITKYELTLSRLRHFFRYCHNAGLVGDNPATKLSAIKISDDDYEVDPYTEKEYLAILKAIPKCDNIGSANRERVKAAMQLQRWSGLSLVEGFALKKTS